jgi:hypothetical protein
MLVIIYHLLRAHTPYSDLGADYFDRIDTAQLHRHHVRRLEQLGFTVTFTPTQVARGSPTTGSAARRVLQGAVRGVVPRVGRGLSKESAESADARDRRPGTRRRAASAPSWIWCAKPRWWWRL